MPPSLLRSTNGQAVVRISAWLNKDRYQNALLTGATSYPLPGKNEAEQQAATPNIDELEASGAIPPIMPKKGNDDRPAK